MGAGGYSCFSFFIGFQGMSYTITLLTQCMPTDLYSLHWPQDEKKKNAHTDTFLVWVFFCCNLIFITEYFSQNKVTEQSGKKPTCL